MFNQFGGGNCTICKSPNTNKSNCPCNPSATNPNFEKHSNWINVCPEKRKSASPIIIVKKPTIPVIKKVSLPKKKLTGPFIPKKYENEIIEYPSLKIYKSPKKFEKPSTFIIKTSPIKKSPSKPNPPKSSPPKLKLPKTNNKKPIWQTYDCSTVTEGHRFTEGGDFDACRPIWWGNNPFKIAQARYYASLLDDSISVSSKDNEICDIIQQHEPTSDWIQAQINYYNNLSDADKALVKDYTYHGDQILNSYLRGNVEEAIDKYNEYISRDEPIFVEILENLLSYDDLNDDSKRLLNNYAKNVGISIEQTFKNFWEKDVKLHAEKIANMQVITTDSLRILGHLGHAQCHKIVSAVRDGNYNLLKTLLDSYNNQDRLSMDNCMHLGYITLSANLYKHPLMVKLLEERAGTNVDSLGIVKILLTSYWKKDSLKNALGIVATRLNNIIANSPPLDRDIFVYRGVESIDYLEKCEIIRGFISTSFDFGAAIQFSKGGLKNKAKQSENKPTSMIMLRIFIPKGTPGFFISNISKFDEEAEIIFPDKSKICIIECIDNIELPDVADHAECFSTKLLKIKICDASLNYP
jgi:hypothetical protein